MMHGGGTEEQRAKSKGDVKKEKHGDNEEKQTL
jgi:hypothetical protein